MRIFSKFVIAALLLILAGCSQMSNWQVAAPGRSGQRLFNDKWLFSLSDVAGTEAR